MDLMFLHCSNNGTYLKVYLGKYLKHSGLPRWHSGKEGACQCRRCKRLRFNPWVRKWQPTPVFLLGKFHGQRNLEDYSPWGCKESDTTEHAHTHTHTAGPLETISPFPYLPPSVISSVSLRFKCNTVHLYLMHSIVLVDQIEFESNSAI